MRKKVKVLEHHSHFLAKMVDIEFDRLSVLILVFLLRDIDSVKDDLASGRLLEQVQTAQKRRLS